MKRLLLILAFFACAGVRASEVVWYDGVHPVSYVRLGKTDPVVQVALDLFSDDMLQVTGRAAEERSCGTVRIIQLDKNPAQVRQLRRQGMPVDDVTGRLDSFWLGVRNGIIYVLGSNGRGCAYGILELSRRAGVSPWIWWSDVHPERKDRLTIAKDYASLQRPGVEYRGIFLNDEDWTVQPWAWKKYDPQPPGVISAKAYRRLFELLLRLRANAIWPGMHSITKAFYLVPGAMQTADSCGIVIGTSHCEPMMRNNVGEWNRAERGEYNYVTNKEGVQRYWIERLQEAGRNENFYTIGMRGIHDGPMEGVGRDLDEKTRWLQQVVDDQRELLRKYVDPDLTRIPQQFVPYKEVLSVMENGLELPDDVMLTWCDDNYGYLTRLSDAQQQKRSGGGGIYYHLSYWGVPHDYLWLCSTQPGLIYNEMREAYRHNVRRMWITNIHEPKIAAYPLELFLDLAWDIEHFSPEDLPGHLERWLKREFGERTGEKLFPVMQEYYRLCGMRRPEFMGWTVLGVDKLYGRDALPARDTEFSFSEFGSEADRYLGWWKQACEQLAEAEQSVPERLRDAFFSHVKYPVLAAASMSTKVLEAQRARSLAERNYEASRWQRDTAMYAAAARSQAAYQQIRRLTWHWNHAMAGGRWEYTMCDIPRDLKVFYGPELPVLLTDSEVSAYSSLPVPQAWPDWQGSDQIVARNAGSFDSADPGVEVIPMLGHSMQALSVPRGRRVNYQFEKEAAGPVVLRIAVIPTQPNDTGDLRFRVLLDGAPVDTVSFRVPYRSETWNDNVQRGQSVATLSLSDLSRGEHLLTLQALDDHVLFDQWMIDPDPDRKFYLFPVRDGDL